MFGLVALRRVAGEGGGTASDVLLYTSTSSALGSLMRVSIPCSGISFDAAADPEAIVTAISEPRALAVDTHSRCVFSALFQNTTFLFLLLFLELEYCPRSQVMCTDLRWTSYY